MSLSNLDLENRCKRYILTDPKRTDVDDLIRDSIITSYREISSLGQEPLAWNIETYDEIFTRYYASISDITAADPGVITADSVDPELSSDHGFQSGDIVYVDSVNAEDAHHKLNNRLFRAVRIDATTLSLKTLNGQDDIDTSDYEAYDTGGTIYHAGIVLPSTIEPSAGDEEYQWKIKRVYDVLFDLSPADPITEGEAQKHLQPGGCPGKWRYQQYSYTGYETPEHVVFWYGFPSQRYNVRVSIEKEYPDPSNWTSEFYLPMPDHIREFVWHRALAGLAMHSEKQRRKTGGDHEGDNTKIEILNAQYWISKAAEDEQKILDYNLRLSGGQAYTGQGMSA